MITLTAEETGALRSLLAGVVLTDAFCETQEQGINTSNALRKIGLRMVRRPSRRAPELKVVSGG